MDPLLVSSLASMRRGLATFSSKSSSLNSQSLQRETKTGVLSQVLYFIANSLTCRGGWFVYVLLTHCPFAVLQHKDYHVFNSLIFCLTLEEFYH